MKLIEDAIATLGIPGSVAIVLLIVYAVLQLLGELIEAFGKVVPEFFKIRKFFKRKREERLSQIQTFNELKQLLTHYSPENIDQRNTWMSNVDEDREWMHEHAEMYDRSIAQITESLNAAAHQLQENTKINQEMFVENSRDRIIDFADKASDPLRIISREQFNRIFKVYRKYENFLEEHNMTNGEVEIAYELICESYADRLRTHNFTEDLRGYETRNN